MRWSDSREPWVAGRVGILWVKRHQSYKGKQGKEKQKRELFGVIQNNMQECPDAAGHARMT